jgi:capping protein beta
MGSRRRWLCWCRLAEEGYVSSLTKLTVALNPDNELTGSWDSLHVFEAHERGRSAKYKLTSTVILVLNTNKEQAGRKEGDVGDVSLSGSMTRQVRSRSSAH